MKIQFRKQVIWLVMGVGAAVMVVTAGVLAQSGFQFAIPWWTVDGGGGQSSSATYSIQGTAGQAEAGPVMQSSSYTFSGGFWPGVVSLSSSSSMIYLPVVLKPSPCFGSGPERNPNNNFSEADANDLLCTAVIIIGLFDDQNDYYAFETNAQSAISAALTGYGGNDAQILLYYQGNLVAQGIHPAYSIQHTGPAGRYYVRIFIPTPNSQGYALHVNRS